MSTMADKRIYQLTVAINKALNPMEAPLKIKHARSAIIITHRTRESKSFWMVCTRQPLMENRFTAWKFCHLLHKVLREGHESVLKQSLTHRKMITEMGKLWGHLQDGVGHCIKAYSKLLVTKINFHEKNRIFPGSLIIPDFADIERYAQGDINVHFQMCVEIFDYLDDIIEVQATVFTSINSYRMSSMTPQGQCRLAPLITLIQDSNPLYDVCVRLMFRLHDELPNDILSGHRDRFRELFRRLKQFYDNVRPLQYFADLIQVPHLPEMSPNFSSRVDFGSYVPPVVHVPEEPEPEHDPMVNDLVDTSFAQQQQQEVEESAPPTPGPTNLEVMQLEQNLRERDQRIFELQSDLIATRESVNMLEQQYKQKLSEMREEYMLLNNELATANEQCANMRLERDELEMKLENTTPTLLAKATEGEEKAKQSEEKFNKLKSLYTSIRDEHIQLLRKHGESTKELNRELSAKQELQQRCEESAKQINELQEKCALVQAQTEQMKELEAQRNALEEECAKLRQNYEALEQSKGNEVEELSKQLKQLALTSQELTASQAEINDLKQQLNATKTNLQATSSEHAEVLLKLQEELKQRLEEIKSNKQQAETLQTELSTVRLQLQQEQTEKTATKSEMQLELSSRDVALGQRDLTIVNLNKQISDLQMDLQQQAATSESNLNTIQATLNNTTSELSLKSQTLAEKEEQLQETTERLVETEQALAVESSKLANEMKARQELEQTVEQLTQAKNELAACLERSNAAAQATKETLEAELRHYEACFEQLRLSIVQQACGYYGERAEDNNNQDYLQAQQTAQQMEQHLQELQEAYTMYQLGNGARCEEVEKLSLSVIALSQQLCKLYEQGNFIAHTAADIERSEVLSQRLHELCQLLQQLHQNIKQQATESSVINSQFRQLSTLNSEVSIMLAYLLQTLNKKTDIGDMVENELNEMDKAIEEAVSRFVDLLSATRQQDAGVQLEVNEKILDACTGLMECIKQLIMKSKLLQDEIVSAGRGKSSVQEFYKRNSQWTEGLISASKSVAKGANLLVDAANKAVESPETSEHFQIIVAAQEIAACTAQLVIASKVKAPQNSAKLGELTVASRNVSKATGVVVATVKSCCQYLERTLEIDVTNLTASQLKAMEMEIHVKVLQLEQALEMERRRLSSFRRQNYQNSEE